MGLFNKKPKVREVYLSKESGNAFPLDKKNRPLVCKEVGEETMILKAMSN